MAAKKLHTYFQAYTIVVSSRYPIKAILHKPGRLLKWVVEMSEYDIVYRSRSSIKGQVLDGFIVELSEVSKDNLYKPLWILETDGVFQSGKGQSCYGIVVSRRPVGYLGG